VNERIPAAIGIIIVFGLLVMPSVRADWVYTGSAYSGTISVSGHDYTYVSSYLFAGEKAGITFQCVEGGDEKVDFVVCDAGDLYLLETQYGSWEMQGSFIGYLQSIHFRGPIQVEGITSWDGEFQAPYTGNWFYLFSNVFSLTTKTVQLTVDTYQWRDPVIVAMAAGGLALCLVGAVAGVAIHHRRRQH